MDEFREKDESPILLLPYFAPPIEIDEALSYHQVAVFLMMTMDSESVRKETKRIANEEVNPMDRNFEKKLEKQEQSKSKIVYNKSTLNGAIRASQKACILAPEKSRYQEYLARLEKMEI